MKTTIARLVADFDADSDVDSADPRINYRNEPIRSTALSLMNEALARVRIREASRGIPPGATRPARLIAMLAAKRRERV
jgi:hypothetical protein